MPLLWCGARLFIDITFDRQPRYCCYCIIIDYDYWLLLLLWLLLDSILYRSRMMLWNYLLLLLLIIVNGLLMWTLIFIIVIVIGQYCIIDIVWYWRPIVIDWLYCYWTMYCLDTPALLLILSLDLVVRQCIHYCVVIIDPLLLMAH